MRTFISYSHADETFRQELEKHLSLLKREKRLSIWHDRRIRAGDDIDGEISESLETADLALFLVSSDFIASNYCYGVELARALERKQQGSLIVVPVIARPCDWHSSPLGILKGVPRDGKPISTWGNRDEAYLDVINELRKLLPKQEVDLATTASAVSQSLAKVTERAARSSNLTIAKKWTNLELDSFLHDSFDFLCSYLKNSALELQERNPEISSNVRQTTQDDLQIVLYRHGKAISEFTVFSSREHGRAIRMRQGVSDLSGGYSDELSVETHERQIGFQDRMGYYSTDAQLLDKELAAEKVWARIMEPLQDFSSNQF